MGDRHYGGDGVHGEMGTDATSNIIGKGNTQQNTTVNVSEPPRTWMEAQEQIQELNREVAALKSVVFGDERFGLNGVMKELRAISQALTALSVDVNSIHEDSQTATRELQKTRAEVEALKQDVAALNTAVHSMQEKNGQPTGGGNRVVQYGWTAIIVISLLGVLWNALHQAGFF